MPEKDSVIKKQIPRDKPVQADDYQGTYRSPHFGFYFENNGYAATIAEARSKAYGSTAKKLLFTISDNTGDNIVHGVTHNPDGSYTIIGSNNNQAIIKLTIHPNNRKEYKGPSHFQSVGDSFYNWREDILSHFNQQASVAPRKRSISLP